MNSGPSTLQRTHDGGSALSNSRRRIIFPTVHAKYNLITTPLFCSTNKLEAGHNLFLKTPLTMTSSIESDMPSLTSLSTVSDSTSTSIPSMSSDNTIRTDANQEASSERKAVRFDPRVWVHEYDRTAADRKALWFTVQDLNTFKFGAMQCIMAYNSRMSSAAVTKTHFKVSRKKQTSSVLFSHPALGIDNDYDDCDMDSNSLRTIAAHSPLATTIAGRNRIVNQFREAVAENEIRHILVVDPQEICLKLYTKGLRHMFPNSTIVTAPNEKEALRQVHELAGKSKSGNSFDVVIYDEPASREDMDLSSGSSTTLFETINHSIKSPGLNIMVMSSPRIATSQSRCFPDTDLRWTKPPPSMTDTLRDSMLKTLLMKRGRHDIVKKLFT